MTAGVKGLIFNFLADVGTYLEIVVKAVTVVARHDEILLKLSI